MIVIPIAVNDKILVSSLGGRNSRLEEWLAPLIHQSVWSSHQGIRHYTFCSSAVVSIDDILSFQEKSVTTRVWDGPARTSASNSAG